MAPSTRRYCRLSLAAKLEPHDVYLHGIAEATPIPVLCTSGMTVIPVAATRPIEKPNWIEASTTLPYREVLRLTDRFRMTLPSEPPDPAQLSMTISHPRPGRPTTRGRPELSFDFRGFEYSPQGASYVVVVDIPRLLRELASPPKPRLADPVRLLIRFPG